jgi:chemosensory pili system protein ChpA (sensor histidine kinase/response regulator)
MNILLIEDELALQKTTATALKLNGHAVVGAETGVQALARLDEVSPDLVLLDLQMPDMDGWEFLRHFRARPGLSEVPVVVVSAAHRIDRSSLDVQAVFAKPFDLDELLDAVDDLLARREAASISRPVPSHVGGVTDE